jgi:hypothetical protein
MPALAAVSRLAYAGAGLLLATSLGLLSYHAYYLSTGDRTRETLALELGPSRVKNQVISIVLIIVPVFVILSVFAYFLSACFLSREATIFLGFVMVVTNVGMVAATIVAVLLVTAYGTGIDQYEHCNYHRNAEVKEYVDGYKGVSLQDIADHFHAKSPTAVASDVWTVCGQPSSFFTAQQKTGAADGLFSFSYVALDPLTPLPIRTPQTWSIHDPIQWDYFYANYTISACHGVVWNKKSLARALDEQDMCLLEVVSVTACAPGYSPSMYADHLCAEFKICQSEYEEANRRWNAIKADAVANAVPPMFRIPVGWNQATKTEAELTALNRKSIALELRLAGPNLWQSI